MGELLLLRCGGAGVGTRSQLNRATTQSPWRSLQSARALVSARAPAPRLARIPTMMPDVGSARTLVAVTASMILKWRCSRRRARGRGPPEPIRAKGGMGAGLGVEHRAAIDVHDLVGLDHPYR